MSIFDELEFLGIDASEIMNMDMDLGIEYEEYLWGDVDEE